MGVTPGQTREGSRLCEQPACERSSVSQPFLASRTAARRQALMEAEAEAEAVVVGPPGMTVLERVRLRLQNRPLNVALCFGAAGPGSPPVSASVAT